MSWIEDDYGERLRLEIDTMAKRFPRFSLVRVGEDLVWRGWVPSASRGIHYELAVVYPENYPYEAPLAYVVSPEIPVSPHRYSGGSLCLFDPDETPWQSSHTAATIVAWCVGWLACQEIWERDGGLASWQRSNGSDRGFRFWPGRQREH